MVKITLMKSPIGRGKSAQATLEALGLHKIRQTRVLEENDANMGQITKVAYLLKVEKVEDSKK